MNTLAGRMRVIASLLFAAAFTLACNGDSGRTAVDGSTSTVAAGTIVMDSATPDAPEGDAEAEHFLDGDIGLDGDVVRDASRSVADGGGDGGSATFEERLTWAPPDAADYMMLSLSEPGTYDLHSDSDYVISAPSRIDGAVHLRGGRNIVWIGGHIHIPDRGAGPVGSASRRGLVLSDVDDSRGEPGTYGYSEDGRIVHIEGLLIDGPDLTEGINTNTPRAIVQLQNIRIDGVHFRNSDDRDGTNGWKPNHPDIIQTWGAQKELRIDGLTGSSAYPAPSRSGSDAIGTWAEWDPATKPQVRNFDDTASGRIYSGAPPEGDYVPARSVGSSYTSPGYGTAE